MLRERINGDGSGEQEADSSAPEEDEKEMNLDNFMITLDSVGDVDGTQDKQVVLEQVETSIYRLIIFFIFSLKFIVEYHIERH